jgi:hypothetical protein
MTDNYYNQENERFSTKTTEVTLTTGGIFMGVLTYIFVLTFFLVWIVGGIAAFIASIVCMFYNSSVGDKIAGFILAVIFGPFYWFFYIYKSSYCNKYPAYMPVIDYYD